MGGKRGRCDGHAGVCCTIQEKERLEKKRRNPADVCKTSNWVKAAVLPLPGKLSSSSPILNRRDHGVEGSTSSAPIMKRFGNQALRCEGCRCLAVRPFLTVSTCKISIVRRCCAPFGEQPHVRPRTRTIKETPALQAAIAKPTRRTGPTSRADAEAVRPVQKTTNILIVF